MTHGCSRRNSSGRQRRKVHRVADDAVAQVVADGRGSLDADQLLRFAGRRRDVWRRDDVGQLRQRPVGRRLLLEHVERRAADLPAVERRDERRRRRSARRARCCMMRMPFLQRREPLGVEQVPGLRRDRQVQREIVGRGAHFVERRRASRRPAPASSAEMNGSCATICISNDRARARHFLADAAEARRCRASCRAARRRRTSSSPTCAAFIAASAAGRCRASASSWRHRQLGDADAVGARRVHHDDAARGGGVEVDVVDAGAGARDDAQRRRGGDHVARDLRRAAHDQRVGIGQRSQQFGQRTAGVGIDVSSRRLSREQGDGGRGRSSAMTIFIVS